MKQRIARHIGNRSVVLGLLGAIWILTGIGRVTNPPPHLGLPHERLPIMAIALMWMVPGGVAVIAAAWRRVDALGWGLLIVPVAVQLVSYLIGWVTGDFTTGWVGASVYAAVVLLINRC